MARSVVHRNRGTIRFGDLDWIVGLETLTKLSDCNSERVAIGIGRAAGRGESTKGSNVDLVGNNQLSKSDNKRLSWQLSVAVMQRQ